MKSTRNAGFTLIELMVVVAIIGILAGILIPTIATAIERGNQAHCTANLREVGQATLLHLHDVERVPTEDGLAFLETMYNKGDGVLKAQNLVCKSSIEDPAKRGQALQLSNVSYTAYRGASDPLTSGLLASESSDIPIAADRDGNTHGEFHIVVFFDGRVEKIKRERFDNEVIGGGFMKDRTLRSMLTD